MRAAYSALVPRLDLLNRLELLSGCRVRECARLSLQTAGQVFRLLGFILRPREVCRVPAGPCWAVGGGPHWEPQGSGRSKALHGRRETIAGRGHCNCSRKVGVTGGASEGLPCVMGRTILLTMRDDSFGSTDHLG